MDDNKIKNIILSFSLALTVVISAYDEIKNKNQIEEHFKANEIEINEKEDSVDIYKINEKTKKYISTINKKNIDTLYFMTANLENLSRVEYHPKRYGIYKKKESLRFLVDTTDRFIQQYIQKNGVPK